MNRQVFRYDYENEMLMSKAVNFKGGKNMSCSISEDQSALRLRISMAFQSWDEMKGVQNHGTEFLGTTDELILHLKERVPEIDWDGIRMDVLKRKKLGNE